MFPATTRISVAMTVLVPHARRKAACLPADHVRRDRAAPAPVRVVTRLPAAGPFARRIAAAHRALAIHAVAHHARGIVLVRHAVLKDAPVARPARLMVAVEMVVPVVLLVPASAVDLHARKASRVSSTRG